MLIVMIIAAAAVVSVAGYVAHANRKAEKQKYYDAAYKVVKEGCLNNAIRNQSRRAAEGQKPMLYLKWKDSEKRGYVFDPENTVRIGRDPEINDICIRENSVSGRHCVLFLYQDQVFIRDLNSKNGTWIKQGFRKSLVQGAEPLFSGDRIYVGGLKIEATVFTVDMAYI